MTARISLTTTDSLRLPQEGISQGLKVPGYSRLHGQAAFRRFLDSIYKQPGQGVSAGSTAQQDRLAAQVSPVGPITADQLQATDGTPREISEPDREDDYKEKDSPPTRVKLRRDILDNNDRAEIIRDAADSTSPQQANTPVVTSSPSVITTDNRNAGAAGQTPAALSAESNHVSSRHADSNKTTAQSGTANTPGAAGNTGAATDAGKSGQSVKPQVPGESSPVQRLLDPAGGEVKQTSSSDQSTGEGSDTASGNNGGNAGENPDVSARSAAAVAVPVPVSAAQAGNVAAAANTTTATAVTSSASSGSVFSVTAIAAGRGSPAGGQPSLAAKSGKNASAETNQVSRLLNVDNKAFTKGVSRGLLAAVHQRGGSLTMRLHPENLGSLKIQLSLTGNTVKAQLHVHNEQAQALLLENITALKSALENKGLTVAQLSVHTVQQGDSVKAHNTAQADQQQGNQQQNHSPDAGQGQSRGRFEGQQEQHGGGSFTWHIPVPQGGAERQSSGRYEQFAAALNIIA